MDKEKKYKVFKLITDLCLVVAIFAMFVDIIGMSSYHWKNGVVAGLLSTLEDYVWCYDFCSIFFYFAVAILITKFIVYRVHKM